MTTESQLQPQPQTQPQAVPHFEMREISPFNGTFAEFAFEGSWDGQLETRLRRRIAPREGSEESDIAVRAEALRELLENVVVVVAPNSALAPADRERDSKRRRNHPNEQLLLASIGWDPSRTEVFARWGEVRRRREDYARAAAWLNYRPFVDSRSANTGLCLFEIDDSGELLAGWKADWRDVSTVLRLGKTALVYQRSGPIVDDHCLFWHEPGERPRLDVRASLWAEPVSFYRGDGVPPRRLPPYDGHHGNKGHAVPWWEAKEYVDVDTMCARLAAAGQRCCHLCP